MSEETEATRQERREKKLDKKKERVQKHGRNIAHIYKEAILKRISKLRADKQKGPEQ